MQLMLQMEVLDKKHLRIAQEDTVFDLPVDGEF